MSRQATTPNSKRKLLLIFTFALLVFSLLRWDISPWLATQIQQAAKQAGVNVQYEHLSVSGFTVQLTQLQISKANEMSVQLQELKASLAWDA